MISVDDRTGVVALLGLVALVVLAAGLALTRIGRGRDLRIDLAVARYDFWLEWHGLGRSRRRDLRDELRANLADAAARVGSGPAVAALGPVRRMAADVAAEPVAGPRWATGGRAAAWVLVALLAFWTALLSGWLAGADASGAGTVHGALPLFPGSWIDLRHDAETFSISVDPGPAMPAVVVLATFVLFSRPWRALAGPDQR